MSDKRRGEISGRWVAGVILDRDQISLKSADHCSCSGKAKRRDSTCVCACACVVEGVGQRPEIIWETLYKSAGYPTVICVLCNCECRYKYAVEKFLFPIICFQIQFYCTTFGTEMPSDLVFSLQKGLVNGLSRWQLKETVTGVYVFIYICKYLYRKVWWWILSVSPVNWALWHSDHTQLKM